MMLLVMLQMEFPNVLNMDAETMDEYRAYHDNNYFLKTLNDVYHKNRNISLNYCSNAKFVVKEAN